MSSGKTPVEILEEQVDLLNKIDERLANLQYLARQDKPIKDWWNVSLIGMVGFVFRLLMASIIVVVSSTAIFVVLLDLLFQWRW